LLSIKTEYTSLYNTILGKNTANNITNAESIFGQTLATKGFTEAIYEEVAAITVLNEQMMASGIGGGFGLASGQKLLGSGIEDAAFVEVASSSSIVAESEIAATGFMAIFASNPIGIAILAIAATTAGIALTLSYMESKNKETENKNREYDLNEKYNTVSKRLIYDMQENGINKGINSPSKIFADAQNNMSGTYLQSTIESRLLAGNLKKEFLFSHIDEFYNDLFKDKNTRELITTDKNSTDKKAVNNVLQWFEDEMSKFKAEDESSIKKHPTIGKIASLKDTTHIRGNSSNYITINIDEMNGIKTLSQKFDKSGSELDEQKIGEIVGTKMIKMLTGAVNDAQIVGNHR